MIFAVLPAAGQSVRMGRPKLALPLGESTILERVVASLRRAGIEHVLVVVGPHVPQLLPLAERAGAHVLQLAEETPDMRATVEAGLRWLEDRFHPAPNDAWLLVPADHPTLDPSVIQQLLRARAETGHASIVVPTHGGRRGHPTLIDWQHVAGMRVLPRGTGFNSYLRQHEGDILEVPVETPDILCDLDTPADYERLRQVFDNGETGRIRLFVYGTLRRGGVRHAVLADQRFLGKAVTRPYYRLFDLGPYPGLVQASEGGQAVHGELYEVERHLVPRLDRLEGAPELYRLEPVELEAEPGPVYTYLYQLPTEDLAPCADGCWGNG